MYPSILNQKEKTINLIIEKLGNSPIDFSEKFESIKKMRKKNETWHAAGILLLIHCKKNPDAAVWNEGEFVFQLIKRSADVPQGGDLSCPGGILELSKDRILCNLISRGLPPILKGKALKYTQTKGKEAFRDISLFLANALRESWEEVRLSPFNVAFLGPLPCYDLTLFTKTIFPVAGLVKKEINFRPNGEVDKIVEIPLKAFFREENYGIYSLEASDGLDEVQERKWDFPCLIHQDHDGKEEILWGATFSIIMSFLKIVFDFELPHMKPKKVIKRILLPDYLTGNVSS